MNLNDATPQNGLYNRFKVDSIQTRARAIGMQRAAANSSDGIDKIEQSI
jgi:hypothetical protein